MWVVWRIRKCCPAHNNENDDGRDFENLTGGKSRLPNTPQHGEEWREIKESTGALAIPPLYSLFA